MKKSEESDFSDTTESWGLYHYKCYKKEKWMIITAEKKNIIPRKYIKSLKDNPGPFATSALRKKKENELHNKPKIKYDLQF